MTIMLTVITLAVMLCPKQIEAAVNGITIVSKDNKVPTYEAGKGKTWTFVVSNNSGKTVNNVTVTPDLGDHNDVWPFKTEMQSYQKNIGSIENGRL